MTHLFHESLYRTPAVMKRLGETRITVCGAGALGSHLAEGLARAGVARLRVIDRDRIEERNLSTQPWQRGDIGALKARVLANAVYRAVGVEVDVRPRELDLDNARSLLAGSDVVVDAFDNSAGRGAVTRACAELGVACLHAGLADGYGEAVWDERYRVPSGAGDDVCDYPLARNLAVLTAALAGELVIRFATTGEKRSVSVTLDDLRIEPV